MRKGPRAPQASQSNKRLSCEKYHMRQPGNGTVVVKGMDKPGVCPQPLS